jgi:PHP family Zn ribbon phosphoesterase
MVTYRAVCPTCFAGVESATREGCQVLADSHVQNHPGHRPPVDRPVDTAGVPR